MSQPAVYGLGLDPMPEGWTPLEAFVVLKCLDEDGHVALWTQSTEGVMSWDAVGMLTAALDTQRDDLRQGFIREDDDDDPFPTFGGDDE